MDYFQDYFQHKPQDDFGYLKEWNQEINEWLKYAYSLDKIYYENNKRRLLKDKQRDEFLGEIKTIYFLGKSLGLKIIEIEPPGKDNTKLDLSFEDLNSGIWKVEVKSPSWLGQLWKDRNLTENQKIERMSKPQHINGEGGSISSEEQLIQAAEDSIKNALPKYVEGDRNLLVIAPNMKESIITMLAFSAMSGGSNAIQNELLLNDTSKLISTVLILETVLPSATLKMEYWHKFIPVTVKPALPDIAEFI